MTDRTAVPRRSGKFRDDLSSKSSGDENYRVVSGEAKDDDRVRLTRLNASTYGLSVKRHTGRWERTPFSGSMEEMVEAILTLMQHLVAPTPGCTGTSGAQH